MVVIIVGMHRSGTSALAGLLHTNGIIMGYEDEFVPKPMPENPKGFYENYSFRLVNDAILAENGYRVASFDPNIPENLHASPALRETMRDTIRRYSQNPQVKHWGWKDPRTSLTLPLWLEELRNAGLNPKVLRTYRPAAEIARSMLARGNSGSEEQFIKLTEEYARRTVYFDAPKLTVSFSNLLGDHQDSVIALLEYHLGVPLPNRDFLDPSLRHQREEAE